MEKVKESKLLIELFIDEADEENGLDVISFVSTPAIESDFMHFSEEADKFKFKATDQEKRIVTGPAMIPDKEIIRMDAEGNPYFVYFTKETVEKAQEVFAKNGKTKESNFEHEDVMSEVTVVESWIVSDPKNDKSSVLGFKDIPEGTWMVSYKVDNDELWEKVKAGEVKGFSIEGVFKKNIVKMSSNDSISFDDIKDLLLDKSLSDEELYNKLAKKLK